MPTGTTAAQYTLTSQPLVTDLTPGDNGSLEALTPNMLAEGVSIDWSEWDTCFKISNSRLLLLRRLDAPLI